MTAAEVGRTGGHVLARQVFAANLDSVPAIRRFVEKHAVEVKLDEDRTFRIQLAVSEACANAIEHSKQEGDITLWAWSREDRFTIDIWHAGELDVKSDQQRRHRGMGLPLMVASADEVSFARLPEGGTRVSLSVFLK